MRRRMHEPLPRPNERPIFLLLLFLCRLMVFFFFVLALNKTSPLHFFFIFTSHAHFPPSCTTYLVVVYISIRVSGHAPTLSYVPSYMLCFHSIVRNLPLATIATLQLPLLPYPYDTPPLNQHPPPPPLYIYTLEIHVLHILSSPPIPFLLLLHASPTLPSH
jgi:hypothetical protein